MPETGEYILSGSGFNRQELPYISLQRKGSFVDLLSLNEVISLEFDTFQRFCIGWRDLDTKEQFTCPEENTLNEKYEQCNSCQKRTGFNPAFYNTTSVSEQQERRNLQPHILYLAHFGGKTTKVGISLAARNSARLLEQGARSGIILDTFPSAHIARQYEAKIAALPNIAESIQLRKKQQLISSHLYRPENGVKELLECKQIIEELLDKQFKNSPPQHFDSIYFPHEIPSLKGAIDCTGQNRISGKVLGMIGSLLFCTYNDTTLYLPLKKYIGYRVIFSNQRKELQLPAQQMSLL